MIRNPMPVLLLAFRSKPQPSSTTSSITADLRLFKRIVTDLASAYLIILFNASMAILYKTFSFSRDRLISSSASTRAFIFARPSTADSRSFRAATSPLFSRSTGFIWKMNRRISFNVCRALSPMRARSSARMEEPVSNLAWAASVNCTTPYNFWEMESCKSLPRLRRSSCARACFRVRSLRMKEANSSATIARRVISPLLKAGASSFLTRQITPKPCSPVIKGCMSMDLLPDRCMAGGKRSSVEISGAKKGSCCERICVTMRVTSGEVDRCSNSLRATPWCAAR